eukprot:scaffold1561_cov129-Cylindrotheca_fusiformis.AAC.29
MDTGGRTDVVGHPAKVTSAEDVITKSWPSSLQLLALFIVVLFILLLCQQLITVMMMMMIKATLTTALFFFISETCAFSPQRFSPNLHELSPSQFPPPENSSNDNYDSIGTLTATISGLSAGLVGFAATALAEEEYEIAELPPVYIPALFGVVLVAGVGVLTASLGDVMDEGTTTGICIRPLLDYKVELEPRKRSTEVVLPILRDKESCSTAHSQLLSEACSNAFEVLLNSTDNSSDNVSSDVCTCRIDRRAEGASDHVDFSSCFRVFGQNIEMLGRRLPQ